MLIFVDVDGTLYDRAFQRIFQRVETGGYNVQLVQRLNQLFDSGSIIIVLTNRPITVRKLTMDELDRIGLKYHGIITSDMLRPLTFKYEFLNAIRENPPILIDDDRNILDEAKKSGWIVCTAEEFVERI